jgi:hypothetical protein
MVTMMTATEVTMVTKIFYYASLHDPTAHGASVNPTSQVSSSTILLLLMVGN